MEEIVVAAVVTAITQPGAVTKFIETVQSGMGVLSRPLVNLLSAHVDGKADLVRSGYAHAEKKQRLLQKAEIEDLKAELASRHDHTGEIVVTWEPDDAEQAAAARAMLTQQEQKRLANVVTIAAEASDHLPPDVSDEPVDPDWVARFFSYAQDVSSEQLQSLWGRILAGEVAKPGGVPLRTLAILRNLSRQEAEAFARVCVLLSQNAYYEDAELLSAEEISWLHEAGLLDPSPVTMTWQPETPQFRQPGEGWIHFDGGLSIHVKAPNRATLLVGYAIAPSAIPIAKLLQRTPSQADLEGFAWRLGVRNPGVTASVVARP